MKCIEVSDVGKVRKNNEDFLGAWPELSLYVVADGMGGHRAGEVASQKAVEILEKFFRQEVKFPLENPKDLLEKAIIKANEEIYLESKRHKEWRGMGTTITAGYFWENRLLIGQVGDSRAYGISAGEITQLTEDHSLVNELVKLGGITEEEASNHPQRNVLTRALGVDLKVEIDFYTYPVTKGDLILFCTDGLSGLVGKDELKEVVLRSASLDEGASQLIKLALDRGGNDNITLILVEVN